MLPSVFVSHGSPMLPFTDVPARDFLRGLGERLPRPRAILVASAHWETAAPAVGGAAMNHTIHDFYGFPKPLYDLHYAAPGAPDVAQRVAGLLAAAGMPGEIDPDRGLDHGVWMPLLLMYPQADIPVVPLAVQSHLGPAHHLRLGRALAPLRDEGVLVIGSGAFTHNLSALDRSGVEAPTPAWVSGFVGWFEATLAAGDGAALLDYRRQAPFAAMNHPTEEHLLPFFVALGAAGTAAEVEHLHASTNYGALRMDAYGFSAAA